jgi:hypothetical protein
VLVAMGHAWEPLRDGSRTVTALYNFVYAFHMPASAGTLYGYLLHGFVAQGAKYGGWYSPGWIHQPLGEVTVTVAAAAIVTVLCTPPVRRVFRFVVEPTIDRAFRPAAPGPAREPRDARRPHEGRDAGEAREPGTRVGSGALS